MIFFFGTRTGKQRAFPLEGVPCPYCERRDTLSATVIPHFVHFFWIPVFRLRPFRSIQCSHCKGVYDAEDFDAATRERIKSLG